MASSIDQRKQGTTRYCLYYVCVCDWGFAGCFAPGMQYLQTMSLNVFAPLCLDPLAAQEIVCKIRLSWSCEVESHDPP